MSLQTIFLRIAAGFFVGTAVFHLWHVRFPLLTDPSSSGRHALFVGINLASAVCLWTRPPWFKYAFGVLVLQQLYSHGSLAWNTWCAQHQTDSVSLVIVLFLPVIWAVLWRQGFEESVDK